MTFDLICWAVNLTVLTEFIDDDFLCFYYCMYVMYSSVAPLLSVFGTFDFSKENCPYGVMGDVVTRVRT